MNTQVGITIANARLERVLGRGFLGDSFVARTVPDNRQVVVKLLHHQFTRGSTFRERFVRIVREAAAVVHPNVVPIADYGEAGGRYFITSEFLPDGSLRRLLQRHPQDLRLARAMRLMRHAADGLAAAHAAALYHRDLKPENILLAMPDAARGFASARVAVTDFGLTQLAELGDTIGGNIALGSLPYLSPEHCQGRSLDARSDIYSFGIVLYEAITGGPPFQVKALADALKKHLSTDPPRPSSVVRDLPVELEQIVLRCLQKDPGARFQSARDLAGALAALGIGEEISINVAPQPAQPPKPGIVVRLDGEGARPPAGRPGSDAPLARWEIKLDQPVVTAVNQLIVYLARDRKTQQLVALRLNPSTFPTSVDVVPRLDASLTPLEERCGACAQVISAGAKFCGRCGADLSVVPTGGDDEVVDAVKRVTAAQHEFVGRMSYANGGVGYVVRERTSGRLVMLKLNQRSAGEPGSQKFDLAATNFLGRVASDLGAGQSTPPSDRRLLEAIRRNLGNEYDVLGEIGRVPVEAAAAAPPSPMPARAAGRRRRFWVGLIVGAFILLSVGYLLWRTQSSVAVAKPPAIEPR